MVHRRGRNGLSMGSAIMALALVATGCAHSLEVKNLSFYKPAFVSNRNSGMSVGLSTATTQPEEERLVTAAANAMKRDGFKVTYPYFPNEANDEAVDFLVKLTTASQYKGSGWNFLINWPGFLLWAPAWHGYNYRAIYTFDADITNAKSGEALPRLSIPVDLNIRHADIGRTWTEISWLEWSVIAFAGGLVFIRYDHDITPQLLDMVEGKVGDYVASKLGAALLSANERAARLRPHRAQRLTTKRVVVFIPSS